MSVFATILAQTEGGGFTDWINQEAAKVEEMLLIVIAVAAIAFVFSVWWRTKALVATISAMVLAGGVVWGSSNVDWFRDKFENEANQSSAPAVVVVEAPSAPAPLS